MRSNYPLRSVNLVLGLVAVAGLTLMPLQAQDATVNLVRSVNSFDQPPPIGRTFRVKASWECSDSTPQTLRLDTWGVADGVARELESMLEHGRANSYEPRDPPEQRDASGAPDASEEAPNPEEEAPAPEQEALDPEEEAQDLEDGPGVGLAEDAWWTTYESWADAWMPIEMIVNAAHFGLA